MKKYLFLIFSIFLSVQVNAQLYINSEADTVKTGDYFTKYAKDFPRLIIKGGVLDFLYGHQSVYIEGALSRFFSLELSAGFSHRDFSEDLYNKVQDSPNATSAEFEHADYTNLPYYFNIRKAKTGYSFGAMPKVYFSGLGMKNMYLGVDFRFQRNNFHFFGAGYDENEFVKKAQYQLVVGFQEKSRRVAYDAGVGFGYRKLNSYRFLEDVMVHPDEDRVYGMFHYTTRGPAFLVYLKIGGFLGGKVK